jgi:hypothetical protein
VLRVRLCCFLVVGAEWAGTQRRKQQEFLPAGSASSVRQVNACQHLFLFSNPFPRTNQLLQLFLHAASGKSSRKRRIKGTVTTPSAPSFSSSSSTSSSLDNDDDDRVTNDSPFQRPDIASPAFNLAKADSKLPPLSGSLEERQAAYNEKSGLQRSVEELLAPTPSGKEPKIVGLAKTVTWGAVILLVLLEIVVSIKVGGAPFDFSNKSGAAVDGKAAPASMPDRSKLQYGYEAE